ncbi:MAG: iron complex outermembrane receptor protein, partial [Candidatus Azotimanducaceae bacterium]
NTVYKDHEYFYSEDYDGTPLNINNYGQDQAGDYLQQEFRLASNEGDMFSWYAGLSFYKEDIDTLFTFSGAEDAFCQYYGYAYNSGMTFTGCADLYAYYGSPFSPSADGNLTETGRIVGENTGWAAYVDLKFELSEQWTLGLGVRYSDDKKDFALNVPTPVSDLGPYWAYTFSTDGFVSDTKSWNDTQTRVIVQYHPEENHMIYASFTDATQAAGFRPNAFDPETVDSWEFGYKGSLFDGRSELNVSAFTYHYKDLQVVVAHGGAASVQNVGQVDAWGFEATVRTLLGDNFDLYLGYSYLGTEANKLTSICGLANAAGCEGSSLFWVPDTTVAVVLSGHFPLTSGGSITSSLEVFYESERGGGFKGLKETEIDAFVDVTLRVGYESESDWSVDIYAENLTSEETFDGLNNNGGIIPSHFFGPKRPRTIGISYSYEF